MSQLASTPMPHVNSAAPSGLRVSSVKNILDMAPRPIPAPEPDPEPNPAPDGMAEASHLDIATVDWDELFHAVTARLEGCVNGTAVQKLVDQVPGIAQSVQTTVLECVSALNQLHAALVRERQLHDE